MLNASRTSLWSASACSLSFVVVAVVPWLLHLLWKASRLTLDNECPSAKKDDDIVAKRRVTSGDLQEELHEEGKVKETCSTHFTIQVTWGTYGAYIKAAGPRRTLIILGSLLVVGQVMHLLALATPLPFCFRSRLFDCSHFRLPSIKKEDADAVRLTC